MYVENKCCETFRNNNGWVSDAQCIEQSLDGDCDGRWYCFPLFVGEGEATGWPALSNRSSLDRESAPKSQSRDYM